MALMKALKRAGGYQGISTTTTEQKHANTNLNAGMIGVGATTTLEQKIFLAGAVGNLPIAKLVKTTHTGRPLQDRRLELGRRGDRTLRAGY